MWASEVERLGFQKCTPKGYRLRMVGGYLSLIAFLFTVAILIGGLLAVLNGSFRWGQVWWVLPVPVLSVLGIVCKTTANRLADERTFEYAYEADEAKWNDGHPRTLTHDEWVAMVKAGRDGI